MAASLAAGALLSAVFNVLLDRLTPELTDTLNSIGGKMLDDKLIRRLKPSLIAARAVLNDAELKQFTDQAVKDWIDELKDAIYELEDLMDEISTRAAPQKQVPYFSFASLNLRDTSMENKLEAITDRIEYIVAQKEALNLKKSSGMETLSWRPPVTSHVKVSDVYGREKEKEDIIKLMFNGDGEQLLSVIPIVGMGRVGKTTLVQLVYNDKDVKQKFDLTVWVCVSEAFDLLKIAQTIMKSISPDFLCDKMDLNLLQLHLVEKLERKRFLVVLDDVWNDKYTNWDTLKNLLHNGVKGSKILVTTRLERVALMVKTISSFYRLNALSDEDCLSIFATHAFHFRDSTVNLYLEKIGRDVASKCKGLPLAAKVLGGLFRSKLNFEDWNNILKDAMWDSLDNEIIPALRVSYYYLPPHLKQCFAYCSLFPEDYIFHNEEIILMWMAEGFLQPSNGNMTLEEVGYGYVHDLTSRSFFQSLHKSDVYFGLDYNKRHGCFVMHDLIHELATHVAGDFFFRLRESGNKISNKARHLSCNFQNYSYLDHGVFQKSKGFRTFMGLNISYAPWSIGNAPLNLLSNMKHLRTLSLQNLSTLKIVPELIGELIHLRYLDLSNTSIKSLPDSICKLYNLQTLKLCYCIFLETLPKDMEDLVNLCYLDLSSSRNIVGLPHSLCKLYNLQTLKLKHCSALKALPSDMQDLINLRYLDLSSTNLVSLPDSLCKLYNLQTLRLQFCHFLEMLPSGIQDLVNLQHLDIRGTHLKEMPRGLDNLKDLQFLSNFIVGKEQEIGIGELGRIQNLKGWIEISKLENIKNGNEAYKARMIEKKHIKCLTLSWSKYGDMEDTLIEKEILESLQPHWDLENLEIYDYGGTAFPRWLGSPSYHNMTWLLLYNCKNCRMLPPLGQLPGLKTLHIDLLESVVSIGDEFLKGNDYASTIPFPSLEELQFLYMTSWEQWHSVAVEAFPKLRQLTISCCSKLVGNLPRRLLSLETLQITACPLFSSCIPRCPKLQKLQTSGGGNAVFQEQELPPSLCTLLISGGQMSKSMMETLSKHLHLQQLTIGDFSNISPLMIHLPQSLQHLNVFGCKNVNFVMSSNAALQNLQSVTIKTCNFVKFMSDDMESLLPNLNKLRIRDCDKMEAEGILVPSLRELYIEWCNVKLILSYQVEYHLLSNITHLCISHPKGRNVKYFPEGSSLPMTLTTLELVHFDCLETLNCTGFQPLTSLQQLKIMYCPKLEKMSGEKLPASLRKLHIWDCPLLEEKYHNKDEQLLHQISHIPHINLCFPL